MLLRHPAKDTPRPLSDAIATNILGYLDRTTDTTQVLAAIKARYARAMLSPGDAFESTDNRYELIRQAIAQAFDSGSYEVVLLRWLLRVVSETATLWTEPGTRFAYSRDGKDVPNIAELVEGYRQKGGYWLTMPQVDAQSVCVGTGSPLITWEGRRMKYRTCPVTHWHAAFADTILDDEQERPVDRLALDEASHVTIRIDGADDKHQQRYQTWFGSSVDYPLGRVVIWHGRAITDNPPAPGPGIQDYTEAGFVDGPPAAACRNPLTVAGNDAPAGHWEQPEYPLAIVYDDHLAQSDRLVRSTGFSRYQESIEFDIAASRLLGSGLRSARGAWVLENPKQGALPQGWDEGMVTTYRDQIVKLLSHPAVNSLDAHKLLSQISRAVAEADGVAGYAVDPDTSGDMSGRAIIAASGPAHRRRNGRIMINRPAQARIFALERLWLHASGEPSEAIPWEVEETWTPGEITLPTDHEADQRVRSGDLVDCVIDRVEAVRQAQGLASRAEAELAIDEMIASAAKNPEYATGKKPEPSPAAPVSPLVARMRERMNGGAQ